MSEGTVRQRERQSVLGSIRRGRYIRSLCRLIDKTIICAAKKYHIKTHESTIKTAAPRGALRVFGGLISGFIHITSEVVFVKVYVREQGIMTA